MQIPSPDFQKNHFQLFGLPERYRIDSSVLEHQFHTLQTQVHPDRFAHLSEAERRVSLQWATRVNEAYQTLKSPIARARCLLALRGVDTQEETSTAMPADFLMAQMEWREAIAEATHAADPKRLEQMEARLNQEMSALRGQLAVALDDERDDARAAEDVRKLRFLEKLAEEIDSAFDRMDT